MFFKATTYRDKKIVAKHVIMAKDMLTATEVAKHYPSSQSPGHTTVVPLSHYDWLEENLADFFEKAGVHRNNATGMGASHGDKACYRHRWEAAGIPWNHGLAIYLLSYVRPYCDEVRETKKGWVSVENWVEDNYERFKPMLNDPGFVHSKYNENGMQVKKGRGKTQYGPGVEITLSGDDVAKAIDAYLVAHDIHVIGPRTITVNGELCKCGEVYVDPSGYVIRQGKRRSGRK